MRKCLAILIGQLMSLFLLSAQEYKTVTGVLTNSDDKKPIKMAHVYPFNTVAEAKDLVQKIKYAQQNNMEEYIDPGTTESYTNEEGYYTVSIAPSGAIVFYVEMSEPLFREVNNRLEINVSMQLGHVLDEVKVTAEGRPAPIFQRPKGNGESIYGGATFPIEKRLGKDNARLVFQTYLLDITTQDTVMFRTPIVMDGVEYHETQLRRMGFEAERDPLFAHAHDTLTINTTMVQCRDTVKIPNPDKVYFYNARLWMEDYNKIYYEVKDTTVFRSDRIALPMRFLQYDLKRYTLNPADFKKTPRRERRATGGKIDLKFLVGQAEIDPDDSVSAQELSKLRSELANIMHDDASTLKEYHIKGFASPDGSYSKNLELANRRLKYLKDMLLSVIPASSLSRVYNTSAAEVAPWSDVADLLYADSLKDEAETIRKIIRKYPNPTTQASMDGQWSQITGLPFYRTLVTPRLGKLRTVTYTSIIELYRELTAEEILEKYNTDAEYRSFKKRIPLYEYWHLFNMVKDPEELEELYRHAYEDSDRSWELPANNLALALIAKDQVDTNILAPFINLGYNINQKFYMNGILDRCLNNEVIVANQVIMMLKAKKFIRAGQISQLLPENRYHDLKMLTRCLAGYWETEASLREEIMNTTPRNKVVMLLAMDRVFQAEEELPNLPQDDPVTHYLKAQILCRKHSGFYDMQNTDDFTALFTDQEYAASALSTCFKMDEKFIKIAKSDYDIYEKLFDLAMKYYKEGDPTLESY